MPYETTTSTPNYFKRRAVAIASAAALAVGGVVGVSAINSGPKKNVTKVEFTAQQATQNALNADPHKKLETLEPNQGADDLIARADPNLLDSRTPGAEGMIKALEKNVIDQHPDMNMNGSNGKPEEFLVPVVHPEHVEVQQ